MQPATSSSDNRFSERQAPVFEAQGLTKVYGRGDAAVHALRGVSIELYPGEFVVLLGPSGSGKSTLLNILGGLDVPTSGSVWIAGAAALLAFVVYLLWPAPAVVQVARVERGPLVVTVDEDGRTRIKERYEVYSPLAGRLRRIELHEGDDVVAGKTLLATIEPSDPSLLDARARAEALARVKAFEAAVEQADTCATARRCGGSPDYRWTRPLALPPISASTSSLVT